MNYTVLHDYNDGPATIDVLLDILKTYTSKELRFEFSKDLGPCAFWRMDVPPKDKDSVSLDQHLKGPDIDLYSVAYFHDPCKIIFELPRGFFSRYSARTGIRDTPYLIHRDCNAPLPERILKIVTTRQLN